MSYDLIDSYTFGELSREWIVPAGHPGLPNEPALLARRINAIGWIEAKENFSVYRYKADLSVLFACLGGSGEALVRGEWQPCRAGMTYLAPAGHTVAFRINSDYWNCCWVESKDASIINVAEPVIVTASATQLNRMIQGLYDEHYSYRNPHYMALLADLILYYGKLIGHPGLQDNNLLRPLWEKVLNDLSFPWTIDKMMEETTYAEDTLRRISLKETGHTPKEYVTILRMRHAASLLVSNHAHSVQWIAGQVGYNDPFAFSTAFRRIIGASPSVFRKNLTSF